MNKNKTVKFTFAAMASFVVVCAAAFEYNVTRPAIRPRWSGAVVGEWTMDREAAFTKAKADLAYTIVLFTGSWWCPICQTCEAKVLTSQAWADYVANVGYYLVECDYPYRFPVPAGQEWKGTSPLGDGWGFKCWLYNADYLAQNGLTAEEGLAAIQKMYDYQDALALPGSEVDVIGRLGGGTMDLHKVPYPSMILFRFDGSEVGRVQFPREWYQMSAVSDEEAIDFMIGGLEVLRNKDRSALFENPTEGGLLGTVATQYQGWIADDDTGNVAGTVTLKAAKANRRTGLSKLTATITMRSGAKVKLTGEAETPSTNKVFNLAKARSTVTASVKLGADGLVGSYKDSDGKSYSLQWGRDVFSARDEKAKARAATLEKGFWPIVLATEKNGGSAFANGYTGLSAAVGSKGKVKVTGTLGDGNKVNVSAQAIVGENGKAFVPVVEKKGAYSFMLEFANGRLSAVTGLSDWKATGLPAKFTATWSSNVVFTAASGTGEILSPRYLSIHGFDSAKGIDGKTVSVSPVDDAIVVARNKWTGTKGVTDLKVTFKPKDGSFKGAFNVYVADGGRTRKLKANVSGVVVDGVPYGTAVIRNVGAWAVEFVESEPIAPLEPEPEPEPEPIEPCDMGC